MARYVPEPGEVEILRDMIEAGRNNKRVPGFLVVTDRRVVLLVSRLPPGARWFLGPLLSWITEQLAPVEMTAQIDRDDFASVEAHGREMFSFHSKGDGYGHISFVVYSHIPFDVLQQRMRYWAAGSLSAASIPTTRPVDR